MDDQINTALIGFGLSGRVFHAPFIHTHPGFHLSVVLERHLEESKKIYPYTEVVRSFKDILNRSDIDLVVVGTPNTLHYPMVKDALGAGKHVIVEKPIATTIEDADRMITAANKSTGMLIQCYPCRYHPTSIHIKNAIDNGEFGTLTAINTTNHGRMPPHEGVDAWFSTKRQFWIVGRESFEQ